MTEVRLVLTYGKISCTHASLLGASAQSLPAYCASHQASLLSPMAATYQFCKCMQVLECSKKQPWANCNCLLLQRIWLQMQGLTFGHQFHLLSMALARVSENIPGSAIEAVLVVLALAAVLPDLPDLKHNSGMLKMESSIFSRT